MRKLIFIFFIFHLQVSESADPNKGLSAATGSFQKVNLLDKVYSEEDRRRLAYDIKETTFESGSHGATTAHKSPDTGETASRGGGANNHHQSVHHSGSSSGRLIVRDGLLIPALLYFIYFP